jgi:hypothetical protein
MKFTQEKLKPRREAAQKERDEIQPMLDDIYRYVLPFRKTTRDTGRGEARVDQVFDHTAMDSAFRFAGKVQQDVWPAGQENFSLEPGPLVREIREREQMAKPLEAVTQVAQAFFDDGDWDMAFHEMALDMVAGTGAILMNGPDRRDPEKLWEPIAVPIDELLLENGPNNKISGIFWTRKMNVRTLSETWPEAKLGQKLEKLMKDKPEEQVDVHVDTVFDSEERRWKMLVWCKLQEGILFESQSRTCPWLTPRYHRLTGETMGRGVAHLAMPTIKTANTAARLQLQAAAIAMLGIYTAVDDGVFNPDLSPLEPGIFWKVARNGGPMGPSVSRFPDPRLDLSNLVLKEMQMGVKATMMDQALPPEAAAVRSATEILERVKRLASDHLGAYGRMVKEIVIPAVKRVLELAYDRGLLPQEVTIDQLMVSVRVKSPIALAREAQRVEKVVEWLQMVLAVVTQTGNPAGAARIAKIEDALTDIGLQLGVPSKYIVTTEERQQMDEQEAQAAAAAMAAAAAAGGGETMAAAPAA